MFIFLGKAGKECPRKMTREGPGAHPLDRGRWVVFSGHQRESPAI